MRIGPPGVRRPDHGREATRGVGGRALDLQVLVMAKEPRAGYVKTRLCPPLSLEEAATVAAAALRDTFAAVTEARVARRMVAVAGAGGPWLPSGFDVFSQCGEGLAERLEAAASEAWRGCRLPLLIIGMDTPQITGGMLETAAAALLGRRRDAVLGPAPDGGYWAIGLRRPVAGTFEGIPMSTDQTCSAQSERLAAMRLEVGLLAPLRDVDTIDDARNVACDAPGSAFARALRRVDVPAVGVARQLGVAEQLGEAAQLRLADTEHG